LRPLLIPAATVIRRPLREPRPRSQCGRREELGDPVAPHPYSPLVGGAGVSITVHLGWRGLAELMVSHAERDEVADQVHPATVECPALSAYLCQPTRDGHSVSSS